MRDAMDNTKRNASSRNQVEQLAHNSNKVTLSSDKLDDHSKLTCPKMHLKHQNTDINIESTSEIESRNGNNAEITIDDYVSSKNKSLRMLSIIVEEEKDLLLQVNNRLNLQILNEKLKIIKHHCNVCSFLAQFKDSRDTVKLTSTDQSLCVIPCDDFVEKTTQEVN